jgi:hypothetical protein
MPRPLETLRKIKRFAHLLPGWHFGEGVPPSHGMVLSATLLNLDLQLAGFDKTNAFPGVDGQIMVTAYHDDFYFEFSLELDGLVNFVMEVGDREEFARDGLSIGQVRSLITELATNVCSISESSTITISTPKNVMSKAWHSGIPPTRREFQLWTKNAFEREVQVPAYTSTGSMPGRPIILPFSGVLPTKAFQRDVRLRHPLPAMGTCATETLKACLTMPLGDCSKPLLLLPSEFA